MKRFWKNIRPYFSSKGTNLCTLFLELKGELHENNHQVVKKLNNYFLNIKKLTTQKNFQFSFNFRESLPACNEMN